MGLLALLNRNKSKNFWLHYYEWFGSSSSSDIVQNSSSSSSLGKLRDQHISIEKSTHFKAGNHICSFKFYKKRKKIDGGGGSGGDVGGGGSGGELRLKQQYTHIDLTN
ncbi:hypothetical protein L6452_16398 [Arctium lappa]|uniref:Uncharacterized protein n=1 Tax=Arctium lappa TaxID=4217 RepID=A0ACB9C0L7_ARCLA|nr:hypothetical protein L6452_16398 [Arctium lappa]